LAASQTSASTGRASPAARNHTARRKIMAGYQAHHCVSNWTPTSIFNDGVTDRIDAFKPAFSGLYLVMTQYA
jgi:hypothetical protein